MKICFATNNQHKLKEARHILGSEFKITDLQSIDCYEELPETKNTFEGNSLQKAKFIFDKYNIPCFADDSGLEVEALNGAPGVFSARYAGIAKNDEANINLLLSNLQGINNRQAQFRTVITYVSPGIVQSFDGIVKGSILEKKTGEGGFGYDPVFVPHGYIQSFAEMTPAQKNSLSHRSIALGKLAFFLRARIMSL